MQNMHENMQEVSLEDYAAVLTVLFPKRCGGNKV